MKPVPCEHWSRCGDEYGGCCAINAFDHPSVGVCLGMCTAGTVPPEIRDAFRAAPAATTAKFVTLTMSGECRPTKKQIRQWLRAEYSLMNEGPVSQPAFEARGGECNLCPHRVDDPGDSIGRCGKCGCGGLARSLLSIMLRMPKAVCPDGRFGEEEGEGRAALDRIGGVRQQVKGQIRQMLAGVIRLITKPPCPEA